MRIIMPIVLGLGLVGCVVPEAKPPVPTWDQATVDKLDREYTPYLEKGECSLMGQAFLMTRGGDAKKAAGQTVTLDPATALGDMWWGKAGRVWDYRKMVPPSPTFLKARRTAVADADGRFKFANLPAGEYYIQTEVTWEAAYHGTQGGVLGRKIKVDGPVEIILNNQAE